MVFCEAPEPGFGAARTPVKIRKYEICRNGKQARSRLFYTTVAQALHFSPTRPEPLCAVALMRFFPRSPDLDDARTAYGMRMLMTDTIFFQMMTVLTSGVLLTDFARGLMPDNDALIGVLAATPPLCQLLQVPAIALVERLRNRRAITVIFATAGRLAWFAYPAIAMMRDKTTAAALLIVSQFWYFGGTYIAGCSISSWIRDLVPEHRISAYFGKRLALATTAGAATLAAVWLILPGGEAGAETRMRIIASCFFVGGIFGLISSWCIGSAPEPEMPERPATPLLALLKEPLADKAFMKFLAFNGVWFAVYGMSWQFFPKVLLARFSLPLTTVTALAMGGLLLNAVFFRIWGVIAVKHDDRSVLSGALPLYLGGLTLWPVAEFLPQKAGAMLACAAFVICGIAFAGMQLGVVNLGLKYAPRGKAAAYIACNSLVMGAASALSPAAGGFLADFLDGKGRFAGNGSVGSPIPGLSVVFIIAILTGLFALVRFARLPAPVARDRRQIYGDVVAGAVAMACAAGGFFAPRRLSLLPFVSRKKSDGATDAGDDTAR